MAYVFIAIALVLAALDGFVFLILKRLINVTGKSIRRGVIRQLGAYDALFAAKSIELAQMQHQAKASKRSVTVVAGDSQAPGVNPALIPPARYRGEGFTESYRHVRYGFRLDPESIYERIEEIPAESDDERFVTNADKLLGRLDFNALYALTALDEEEQLEVCREACTEGERELLDEYMTLHERFSAPEFVEALRAERDRRDNTVRVRAARNIENMPPQADVCIDTTLCEGMTLIKHGVLYDYSISEREIG